MNRDAEIIWMALKNRSDIDAVQVLRNELKIAHNYAIESAADVAENPDGTYRARDTMIANAIRKLLKK